MNTNKATRYAINIELDDHETIESTDVMKTAMSLRTDYPTVSRVISIDGNVINAVKAALKTGSGIGSSARGLIATNIYNLSKIELAVLIASNDSSDLAFDRAAYEVSRDAFTTGGIEAKAAELAVASGRTQEACLKLIRSKLSRKKQELMSRLNMLKDEGLAPASADEVRDDILASDGAFLLALPTAYGKTSLIIEPVLQAEMARGAKVLVISHRRSINRNIANIDGIASYDECDTPDVLRYAQGLKIVVNSLSAPRYKAFIEAADVVVIDEAAQVIAHVLGGEVKNREDVWDTLKFVVKNAKKVILADADINTRCVELIDRPAKLFRIAQDHSDISVRTSDSNTVRGMIIKAAGDASKNVLVACDGAKEAAALAKYIEKKTQRQVLVITAENAKWEAQAAFIANPNTFDHGIVIYSPVITSALSITSGHFTDHFGLFGGQVVPSDAIQMLRRDRTAKSFTVGLKNPDYRKSEIVEVVFNKEMVATEELLRGLTISTEAKTKIREAIALDNKPSAFQALQYDHCSNEAWLKDSIQNTLPAMLLLQGFSVEAIERNEDMSKSGFLADSTGRRSVKKEIVAKLMSAKAAETDLARLVRDAGSKDEVEYMSVIKARAQHVMGLHTLKEADAKLWGEGEGEAKINRFVKLYTLNVKVTDEEKKVFAKLLPAISAMVLTKGWRSSDSADLFDSLNLMRSNVIGLGINMSSASSVKAKQASVTNILKSFGIRTKKVAGTHSDYYIIESDSLEQMIGYIN